MKRAAETQLDKPGDVSSDDSSDSDSDGNGAAKGNKFGLPNAAKGSRSDGTRKKRTNSNQNTEPNTTGTLVRKAEMYQEYMKHIPIPAVRGSQVPFTSWQGLADSLKALYHQPLHYLTNLQLRQWDCLRLGLSGDEACVPLDDLIHPVKAEALVWLMEETHRLTASPLSLAKIWASDDFYHAYIDPVFP
ncbi:hypothetical protein LUZ61_003662 [Rhynchospora tenuis]|uniref:Uncharacterized protein n=1 Tax=Rhynchospora tenuis TaxID=198213 RepID=A0AAD6ESX0_9POAL|nr:hypothetical protein LUZ61_003662 [Rhynchospora tenuis]